MEITLIAATYVVSAVLVYSSGPWGVLEVLRNEKHVKAFGLLDCFLCVSFWIALIASIASHRPELLFLSWASAYVLDALIQAYRTK